MFDLKTKILVVDDMAMMRKVVIKCCKDIGFTDFVEAGDGNEGWAALQKADSAVGIVFSDWNMPNCTGLDFLKKVRNDDKLKALPFIMLTAETEESLVAEAVKSGASNFISKPFTKDIILEKLTAVSDKLGNLAK
jgi:two-component system chemotaxis response regulator CheY